MRLDGMRLDDEQAIDELARALASQHPSFRAPRVSLVVLRSLCEKGRATPPRRDRVLGALFAGTGGGSRRKGAAVVIPREVFWKVFEFWPCSH